MTSCPKCGHSPVETSFCPNCGNPLGSATVSPQKFSYPSVPSGMASAKATFADTSVNFIGAAIIGAVIYAANAFLGLIVALVAKPEGLSFGDTLTLGTILSSGAFGGNAKVSTSGSGAFGFEVDGAATAAAMPFTLTIMVSVLAVMLFKRLTSGHARASVALIEAAVISAAFAVLLALQALIFTTSNSDFEDGLVGQAAADELGIEIKIGASFLGTLGSGFVLLLLLFALVSLARTDWWSGVVATISSFVSAPLKALSMFVVALPAIGVIGYLLVRFFGDDTVPDSDDISNRTLWTTLFAFAGNAGMFFATLGTGGSTYAKGKLSITGEDTESGKESSRLWGEITESEPALWLMPFVVLVVLAAACWWFARTLSNSAPVAPQVLVWVGSWILSLPVLNMLLNVNGKLAGEGSAMGETLKAKADGTVGSGVLVSILVFIVLSALLSSALLVLTGKATAGQLLQGASAISNATKSAASAAAAQTRGQETPNTTGQWWPPTTAAPQTDQPSAPPESLTGDQSPQPPTWGPQTPPSDTQPPSWSQEPPRPQ